MSLHDRLNAVTKTKEEVRDAEYEEGYEEGITSAEICINYIQERLMDKVKHGEYTEQFNGKKYVEIFYSGEWINQIENGMGLELSVNIVENLRSPKNLVSIIYNIVNQGKYDGFVHKMFEFSLQEEVSFKILCKYNYLDEVFEFNPVVGTQKNLCFFQKRKLTVGILCSVTY